MSYLPTEHPSLISPGRAVLEGTVLSLLSQQLPGGDGDIEVSLKHLGEVVSDWWSVDLGVVLSGVTLFLHAEDPRENIRHHPRYVGDSW